MALCVPLLSGYMGRSWSPWWTYGSRLSGCSCSRFLRFSFLYFLPSFLQGSWNMMRTATISLREVANVFIPHISFWFWRPVVLCLCVFRDSFLGVVHYFAVCSLLRDVCQVMVSFVSGLFFEFFGRASFFVTEEVSLPFNGYVCMRLHSQCRFFALGFGYYHWCSWYLVFPGNCFGCVFFTIG